MPTESQEIGSDNKKQKNIKDFRKEIISKITSAKIERKYCKQLIKTINSDDLAIFFNSLIKADSLFWFLNIVHHLYQELFSLYNNKKFLVFDELLLENLKNSWQWIEKERQIFNEEHNLITELKNIAKEAFPEQYFEIIKFKQEQSRINFDYFFPELKLPDNAINFWKQIIQEENLEQFLSVEWKEKIAELCNVFINFEKNIKKFKIIGEDYQEFIFNHKRNLEKVKECSEQVALVSNVMKRKQFLIDLEDYNNESYYNSFQKKIAKSINELKNFINNIEDSRIMDYYYQFLILNSSEQFAADSLEWNINRICGAINHEFTILKKISDSYTSDLAKNFIMKYITEALNLTKSTSERIKEITLQFDRHCEQLFEEENKLIEVINKKIAALENINKTERTTYENLSRTLENVSLDNDKKMIAELKQQIEKIRTITKEKITESKKKQEEAIEEEEKQKMLQLEETKQGIINNTNLMKDNIKNYHQKIIEFIKFFTISLYEFILWFKNNEWDREKYKLNNTINNILQPGLIIKIEYKNDNLQYKLPWSNFIYLKTENDNHLVLAIPDSEEANFQILNKEGRKILLKKLIEEEKYYFLSRKFCNLYTKFTLVEDNFLSEKEVSKIFKKIEVLENIKTIENETPQLTNNKQKEFFQAKLNEIFQKIEEQYQSLITSLKEIIPIERLKVINSWKTIDNNENVATKNEDSLLFETIIKYIDTYIEDLIPKIKAKVEKEWEETEDEDWDAVEAITTAFKSDFEKKDTEIEHLKKILEEKEEKIAQLETQLKNVLPKKDSPIVIFNDIKEQWDLEFLPILENNFDELEQSKESDSSRNLSSTSLTSY